MPLFLLSVAIALSTVCAFPNRRTTVGANNATPDRIFSGATLPLTFEANRGQAGPGVRFTAAGNGFSVELTPREARFILSAPRKKRSVDAAKTPELPQVVRMSMLGAASEAEGAGEIQQGSAHYLKGNRPSAWLRNVPSYRRVRFASTYPGLDTVYYGDQRRLEYDFIVAPAVEPTVIRLGFADGNGHPLPTRVDESGELILHTEAGELRQSEPVLYQEIEGQRRSVSGGWVALANGQAAFQVGDYDPQVALVIDPALHYFSDPGAISTSVAVDDQGFPYVTGAAFTEEEPDLFVLDSFVRKFSRDGSSQVYSTTFGGHGTDFATGIAVDRAGGACVTGSTDSTNFPTVNPIQESLHFGPGGVPNEDAFLVKISPDGDSLDFSTYLGGGERENLLLSGAVATDSNGNVYLSGDTNSLDFPTVNAAQPESGNPVPPFAGPGDAFLAKIEPAAGTLLYSTYLGGSIEDGATALAVSPSGEVTITGYTSSEDFPIRNPAQSQYSGGEGDAFVSHFNAAGELLYSTFLGGGAFDGGLGIAVDGSGAAYIAGSTNSADFPTANAFQSRLNGGSQSPSLIPIEDGFVTKLSPEGDAILYSTFLGGAREDLCTSLRVESDGSIVVCGGTVSNDFPVLDSPQRDTGRKDPDAFLVRFDPSGAVLAFSAYLGTADTADIAFGLALDAQGNQFVAGVSEPNDAVFASTLQKTRRTAHVESAVAPSRRARAFINRLRRTERRGAGRLIVSTRRLLFKASRPGLQQLAVRVMNAGGKRVNGRIGSVSAPFALVSGGGAFALDAGESRTAVVQYDPSGGAATERMVVQGARPTRARKVVSLVARGG